MELPWKGRSEVTVGGCLEGAATYGSPSPSLSRPVRDGTNCPALQDSSAALPGRGG